jgi:molybdate transport system substrate-binding protein
MLGHVGWKWLAGPLLSLAFVQATTGCGGAGGTAEQAISSADSRPLLVLAAASLTEVLGEIGPQFNQATGIEVNFSYGGSDSLAGQVRAGAPADAVIFAGAGPLDGLEAAGLTVPGSRRDVASNRLVVIAAEGSGRRLDAMGDLGARQGKVAIADPQLAPAGRYARAAMQAAGVWEAVAPRTIPGLDVRNAAAAVAARNAEFGFVYETDAAAIDGLEVVLVVPDGLYPPIVYPAAVLIASRNVATATAFLDFFRSDGARAAFAERGFGPPL